MLKKNNFLLEIFENEQGIPQYFDNITYNKNGEPLFKSDIKDFQYDHRLYHTSYIPDYLKTKLNNENKLILKKFGLSKGYCIDLSEFENVEHYLKFQFKKNAKTIRRYVNRLESCFNIEYKLFYGHISKIEYDNLLMNLRSMIVQRFKQRNEASKSLKEWNRTVTLTYPLILEKRASIFVIYNNGIPIEIAINYHYKRILFSYISSYDIDYAKFGLGHVEIYKQLEWCIANNFHRFEMGWGDLDYKRRWSNDIYNFEQHLFTRNKSLVGYSLFKIKEFAIRLKLFLISKNVHVHLRNLKRSIKNNQRLDGPSQSYEILPIEDLSAEMESKKIDYELENHTFLRKIVNDFLYRTTEHLSNIEVFEVNKNKVYIIKGSKHAQKVIFTV